MFEYSALSRRSAPDDVYRASAVEWFEAGGVFSRLIPVIPPDAVLAFPPKDPTKDSRGKMPGRRRGDGLWGPLANWPDYRATRDDCLRWDHDGASLGLVCGRIVGIDIDIVEEDLALDVRALALGLVPGTPSIRTGQAPKHLLLYQTAEPFSKMALSFTSPRAAAGDKPQKVEILAEGQQFVVEGIHPKTGRPYTWDCPPTLLGAEGVPFITKDQCAALLDVVETLLKARGYSVAGRSEGRSGARGDVDPAGLEGDMDLIEAAVLATPNDDRFASRDLYVKYGHALKAATVSNPARGFALWLRWGLQWPGNSDEELKERWAGFDPAMIGARFIFEMAHEAGWWGDLLAAFGPFEDEPADYVRPEYGPKVVELTGAQKLRRLPAAKVSASIGAKMEAFFARVAKP